MKYFLRKNESLFELVRENQYAEGEFHLMGKKYEGLKGLCSRLRSMENSDSVDFSGLEGAVGKEDYMRIIEAYTGRKRISEKTL